jgi:hypothetical protein
MATTMRQLVRLFCTNSFILFQFAQLVCPRKWCTIHLLFIEEINGKYTNFVMKITICYIGIGPLQCAIGDIRHQNWSICPIIYLYHLPNFNLVYWPSTPFPMCPIVIYGIKIRPFFTNSMWYNFIYLYHFPIPICLIGLRIRMPSSTKIVFSYISLGFF